MAYPGPTLLMNGDGALHWLRRQPRPSVPGPAGEGDGATCWPRPHPRPPAPRPTVLAARRVAHGRKMFPFATSWLVGSLAATLRPTDGTATLPCHLVPKLRQRGHKAIHRLPSYSHAVCRQRGVNATSCGQCDYFSQPSIGPAVAGRSLDAHGRCGVGVPRASFVRAI